VAVAAVAHINPVCSLLVASEGVLAAEDHRWDSGFGFEFFDEVAGAAEAAVVGDLGDGSVGGEKLTGGSDEAVLEEVVEDCAFDVFFEGAAAGAL